MGSPRGRLKTLTMAGLDPATHLTVTLKCIFGAQTRAGWVAGSSPAMVI